MKESLDFIKNFEKLLQSNEEEEKRIGSLKSVKVGLEEDIAKLEIKKIKTEEEIKFKLESLQDELDVRKSNFERSFESERKRIEKSGQDVDERSRILSEDERTYKQRAARLNEKEQELKELKSRLDEKESDLLNREELAREDFQKIATANMKINNTLNDIANRSKGLEEADNGLQLVLDTVRKEQAKLKEREIVISKMSDEVEAVRVKNIEDRKSIEAELVRISKESKTLDMEKLSLEKQKKDNLDKENALKAMQVELDFKIAQFKRKYEKDIS